jgi:ribosomal protein S7
MALNTITSKSKPLVVVNTAMDNAMSSLRVRSRFYGGVRVTHLFSFICHALLYVIISRVPC